MMAFGRTAQMQMLMRSNIAQRRSSVQAPKSAGGGLQDIVRKMQAAQEKANLANEQRYRQILGQFSGLGKAGRARI